MTRLSNGESRRTRGGGAEPARLFQQRRQRIDRAVWPSTARRTISAAASISSMRAGDDVPVADADIVADLLFAGHAQGGEGAAHDEAAQFVGGGTRVSVPAGSTRSVRS